MSNQEELIDIWKFNSSDNEYISINDDKCFKQNDILKLSYFYRTHVLPLPFMGEVDNPDVLILALNPSYDPINDEEDTKKIKKENYINDLFDVDFFSNIENSRATIGEHTFNWWKTRVFNNVELNGNYSIGIFNLCGYHSREYRKIQSTYLKDNSYLPTQNMTKEIVSGLINKIKTKLIIVIWGKDSWKDYLGFNLNKGNVVVLNEYINYNCSIYNYCIKTMKNREKVKLIEKYFKLANKKE